MKIDDIYNPNYSQYRKRAFKFLPHRCAICSFERDSRLLEVHHIDEDRSNNRLDNLKILCPTCHQGITLGYYLLNEDDSISIITEDGEVLDWEIKKL